MGYSVEQINNNPWLGVQDIVGDAKLWPKFIRKISIGLEFYLAKSSLNHCVRHVVKALYDIGSNFIKWPSVDRINVIMEKFARIADQQNVIGAIDCTHIEIPAPYINAQSYLTRKYRHAVTLQAVCDTDPYYFIDCFARYLGSVSDIRIFRNSDLWQAIHRNRRLFFPNEEFIIGDKACPLLSWCLISFKDNGHLTQVENNFNHILCQTRQTIERAFALLKGRFRCLTV
ncbi:putative nuclease HARBI1 [Harpegnathos saltator]|uniref:putative nuclease HARBI1 n=1 Tax=Harpegnathos saltator TaxID=610380 RepID=UPI000DBED99F|nr:putative nuclease HARBI1 [Harpegnathos saltator]